MSKKKVAAAEPARARMVKELREAIEEIDEEGLLFLLRQAQVLIHNARVDRLARESAGDGKAVSAPVKAAPAAGPPVSVEEAEGGKVVFLTIGGARKVLSADELKRLVRICYAAESKSEALRQLHKVLSQERNDILFDARIGSPGSPLLEALFSEIRSVYRLKDR